jgi:uncharacterized protein (TIGR03067 family)
MRFSLALAAVAGLLLAADKPKKGSAKQDAARMQGDWQIEDAVRNGEALSAKERKEFKIRFKGNKMIILQGSKSLVATFKLDPSKKPKPWITAVPLSGTFKKKEFQGIYEFPKVTNPKEINLYLCLAEPGRPRPTIFASTANSGKFNILLKKIK